MLDRPQKITFGEMRDMGVRGVLIYCRELSLQPLDRGQRRPLAGRPPALRLSRIGSRAQPAESVALMLRRDQPPQNVGPA
jgi:hypothetical protein